MKFSADKNVLYEAVAGASKACAVKSSLNILDGVLLSLEGDRLTVTGYDLEVGIKITASVDGREDGSAVADPKLLSEMVRKMPGDTVDFLLKDKKEIRINSGKTTLNIPCKSGEDFPNVIELKKDFSFTINEKLLKEMITRVEFSAARTDSNPSLMGIKMEIEDNVLYSVATDGNRLAAKYNTVETPNIDLIIPEKAIQSLNRSLTDSDDKTVEILIDRNQICVSKENYVIISRLLDGKFVNYRRIIDAQYPRIVNVNTKELASSMERCLLLMSDKIKSPVSLSVDGEFMKISCKTTIGSIEEEISVKITEGDFKGFGICFNPRFMLEALQKTLCENVKISFDSELKPFKITPVEENGEFIFIIVPIRSS